MDNCEVEQFWQVEGAGSGIEWFKTFMDFRIAFRRRLLLVDVIDRLQDLQN